MTTPIVDFVKNYADKEHARFHMPGHKGQSFLGCEKLDITEIPGADVLYMSDGIIEESEQNATSLFKTFKTCYSTEGSSHLIRAMIGALAAVTAPRKPLILSARNAHKSFIYACACADAHVKWLYPSEFKHLCCCKITSNDIADALADSSTKPDAIYITSPDYLGNITDIRSISAPCEKNNILLLVDNAHGAYLNFLEKPCHPIHLGADVCADSAHKSLPVLTGGAYLHFSRKCPQSYMSCVLNMLRVYASTSPSYLTLQSLDRCNKYIEDNYHRKLKDTVNVINNTKQAIKSLGFDVADTEPLKIVIDISNIPYDIFSEGLCKYNVSPEMCDSFYAVFMITPENTSKDFDCLLAAMRHISVNLPQHTTKKSEENIIMPSAHETPLSIRQAIFSRHETVTIDKSVGRICASPAISCPPAIPIVASGEIITYSDYLIMKKYSIHFIDTVLID